MIGKNIPFRLSAVAAYLGPLIVGLALLWLPAWQVLEKRGFDLLSVINAPGTTPLPIFLIAIDDESLREVPHRYPWPRALHARVVDKLSAAGAAVIAFDVLFSQPSSSAEDRQFADAVARAGNVVLATGLVRQETDVGTLWVRQEPMEMLQSAGAQPGVVNLAFDRDLVMRTVPTDPDAFWRKILIQLRRAMPEQELPGTVPEGGLIRYVGPPGAIPSMPFHKALELEKHVDPAELAGAVVIIGRATRAAIDIGMAQGDLFSTPFAWTHRELTPGAEIHANILDSVIRQQTIQPVSAAMQGGLLVLLVIVGNRLLALRRSGLGYLLAGMLALVLPLIAWRLFVDLHRWLPVGAPLVTVALLVGGKYVQDWLSARRERDRVRRMFALYVPPDVVKVLMDHPERAGLGGETRRLTVLFCDLRGFTTLSTQLPPAEMTALLNRYFTAMTNAILGHGGTLDKFIGDAVMAFWGAPLPDPDQERHAVRAAQDMRDAMAALNESLAAEGKPPLRLGIGIHTGEAVVGNMGAESRLSYTAIGDTVNTASRLEGATKALGVEIVLSAETARANPEGLRPMGTIRVKGRPEPVDVFSPCPDAEMIELTRAAFAAQGSGDFTAAVAHWRAIQQLRPDDRLASWALECCGRNARDDILEVDK